MNNSIKLYTGLLVLLIVAVTVFELSRPQPVDWTPTFNENHTKPYGLKVFYNELKQAFRDSVRDVKVSPYEFFNGLHGPNGDSTYQVSRNYVYINGNYTPDALSTQELLHYVAAGNTVFIASEEMPKVLQDSLEFSIDYDLSYNRPGSITLANPRIRKDSVFLEKGNMSIYFSQLNPKNTTVLGYQDFESRRINFAKIKYGNGNFLLHTHPYIFTNYYLLKDENYKYVENVISYLPQNTVFFDSQDERSKQLGNSPLRYILSQPSLKWAWYIGLLSILIFMLFNAKRKQRIVNIISPLENTTVAFTKTIGNLYYETKDHTNLIDKKITYFLERIRNDYYLETTDLNDKFIQNLASKTGKDKLFIKKLIALILKLQSKPKCTEQDLLKLNETIEKFYIQHKARKEK